MCILVRESIELLRLLCQGRLKVEVAAVLIVCSIVFVQLQGTIFQLYIEHIHNSSIIITPSSVFHVDYW